MSDEFPPLGKYVVFGNESDSQDFPILSIAQDQTRGGYDEPNFGDAIPAGANLPGGISAANYVFHKSTVIGQDTRIHWIYQKIPGPWIYDQSVDPDPESLAIIFEKRRNNIGTNIIPGSKVFTGSGASLTAVLTAGVVTSVVIGSGGSGYGEFVSIFVASGAGNTAAMFAHSTNGTIDEVFISDGGSAYSSPPVLTVLANTLQVTDRKNGRLYAAPEDMDANVSHEVVTITPQPLNYSQATSKPSYRSKAYEYPGRFNIYIDQNFVGAGQGRPGAQLITITGLTWWYYGTTPPTPASLGVKQIIYDSFIYKDVNGEYHALNRLLHDSITTTADITVTFPPTTPSYFEFIGAVPLLTGNATFTNASTAVTGSGTNFTILQSGDNIAGSIVDVVTDDTHMTIRAVWPSPTVTFAIGSPPNYVIRPGLGWVGNPIIVDADIIPVGNPLSYKITIWIVNPMV